MSTHTECCALLDFVLRRARNNDRTGLMAETMYARNGAAKPRDTVVVRFHRDKDPKVEGANAIYAEIEFCPFCGKPRPQPHGAL